MLPEKYILYFFFTTPPKFSGLVKLFCNFKFKGAENQFL